MLYIQKLRYFSFSWNISRSRTKVKSSQLEAGGQVSSSSALRENKSIQTSVATHSALSKRHMLKQYTEKMLNL